MNEDCVKTVLFIVLFEEQSTRGFCSIRHFPPLLFGVFLQRRVCTTFETAPTTAIFLDVSAEIRSFGLKYFRSSI